MPLHWPFARRVQAQNCTRNDINGLPPSGSWTAFILASIAAILLIFSACAMNASQAWAMGAAEGPFRAIVLAGASIGAAILAPIGLLAATKGRGFGTRIAALLLAAGCLVYTSASSLGFIATARDAAVSGRSSIIEAHQDRRVLAKAAQDELASLKGQRAEIVERRAELTAILVRLSDAAPDKTTAARPDAQASALAFYIRAAGWHADDAAVSVWLSLVMVLILEAGAALSLTVAAALRPERVGRPLAATAPGPSQGTTQPHAANPDATAGFPRASQQKDRRDKDDPPPPPPKPRGKGGRPNAILPEVALAKLHKAGKANGSIRGVAKLLGTSKSTAHRMLHQLASAGLIRLQTTPAGCSVALA